MNHFLYIIIIYNNVRIIMNISDISDEIYDHRYGSHKSFYQKKRPSNLTHMTQQSHHSELSR